jgi:hypothetical protein
MTFEALTSGQFGVASERIAIALRHKGWGDREGQTSMRPTLTHDRPKPGRTHEVHRAPKS